ncbi:hypothetical protein ACE3NQ_00395 [Paenibacillus terreus]|uniref:Uncharacterized protein n=1 Tax=Paenibacillus terreus TaxID=1387834 RepID=A0ABV5B0Y4_9BACL
MSGQLCSIWSAAYEWTVYYGQQEWYREGEQPVVSSWRRQAFVFFAGNTYKQ